MPGIFISYRREQTGAYAGRLYDRLAQEFGHDRVFMDLSAITPGADFVERIEEAVGAADALLVVMGPNWADMRDGQGGRRLEDPEDFVRREILGAIERDKLLVPVLVHDAAVPAAGSLPGPLQPLSRRNGVVLSDTSWSRDVDHLVATLRPHVGPRPGPRGLPRRPRVVAATALAVALAVVLSVIALQGDEPTPRGPAAQLASVGVARLGGQPFYAATAGGKVWVSSLQQQRLKIIDPGTRAVSSSNVYGQDLRALVAVGERLFVGDEGARESDNRGAIVEVDTKDGRIVRRLPTRIDPFELATDGKGLWVVGELGTSVQRIDLRTRSISTRSVDSPLDVALLGGRAWVLAKDSLVPFDATTARDAGRAVPVGTHVTGIAAAAGALWLATDQGQLLRLVPGRAGVVPSVVIGGEGRRSVAADSRGVWVVDQNGRVVLVDPSNLSRQVSLQIGGDLQGLTLAGAGAWVLRNKLNVASTAVHVVRRSSS